MRAPEVTALFFPVQPAGSGGASITRTVCCGKDEAMARVWSVEWSSTTMISKGMPVCAISEARQAFNEASSLRAGTMIETVGESLVGGSASS